MTPKKMGGIDFTTPPKNKQTLWYSQRPDAASVGRGVQHVRTVDERQSRNFYRREAGSSDCPSRRAACQSEDAKVRACEQISPYGSNQSCDGKVPHRASATIEVYPGCVM